MLQPNKALARKVAREMLIQEEMSQAQEDEVSDYAIEDREPLTKHFALSI